MGRRNIGDDQQLITRQDIEAGEEDNKKLSHGGSESDMNRISNKSLLPGFLRAISAILRVCGTQANIPEILPKLKWVLLESWYVCRSSASDTDVNIIRDKPDFWAPFVIICVFAYVHCDFDLLAPPWAILMWLCGSSSVWFLGRVLGGTASPVQVLSVTGYSALCLCVIAVVSLPLHPQPRWPHLLLELLGLVWASLCAVSLVDSPGLRRKRVLVLYPLILFFIYLLSLSRTIRA